MDKLEQLIREIETKYNALTLQTLVFGIKGREREEAKAPPQILFVEIGGEEADGKRIGGNTGSIGTLVVRCACLVWNTTVEGCRNTWFNLRLASRQIARGPNVRWRSYELPTEAKPEWAKRGHLMQWLVEFDIPIPGQVSPEATILHQAHQVTVGAEVVC